MSKTFKELTKTLRSFHAAGLNCEGGVIRLSSDSKVHSKNCADLPEERDHIQMDLMNLLQTPERLLHSACVKDLLKSDSIVISRSSGFYPLSRLIEEGEILTSTGGFKEPDDSTFEENIANLKAIEDLESPVCFDKKVNQAFTFPDFLQAKALRKSIIKHLVKNENQRTWEYALNGPEDPQLPFGIKADLRKKAKKVGKIQELTELTHSIKESVVDSPGYYLIDQSSYWKYYNGGVSDKKKAKIRHVRSLLDGLLNERYGEVQYMQVEKEHKRILDRNASGSAEKWIRIPEPLEAEEVLTFNSLIKLQEADRSDSLRIMHKAYQSTLALRK